MADNSNDIFKQLQQHEMQPPADAFNRAWGNRLHIPVEMNDGEKTLEKLRDYSITPPEVNLGKIMAGEKTGTAAQKTNYLSSIWLRAAAVLLVMAAGLAVYLISNNKKDNTGSIAAGEQIKNSPAIEKKDTVAFSPDTQTSAGKDAPSIAAASARPATGKNTGKGLVAARKNNPGYITDGIWSFTGNDVLYTLVNYKENGQDKLFYKILSAKKITLNQYSYINLSDKMVGMLQELYITKKNGKPSRKAKKAKKKFEKWRKKDEKYFDREPVRNPADIIDLSDFLMNN